MSLLDEEAGRWYCYRDDEVYFAKENRWMPDNSPSFVVRSAGAEQKRESPELRILGGAIWIVFAIFLAAAGWTLMAVVGFLAGIGSIASGIAAAGQPARMTKSNTIESSKGDRSIATGHAPIAGGLGGSATPTSATGSCPYCGAEVFKQNMSCWSCTNPLPFDGSISIERVTIGSLAGVTVRSFSRTERGADAQLDVAYGYYPTKIHTASFVLTWNPSKVFGRVTTGGLREVHIGTPTTLELMVRVNPPSDGLLRLIYDKTRRYVIRENLSMIGLPRIDSRNLSVVVETSDFDSRRCIEFLKNTLAELGKDSTEPGFSARLDQLCRSTDLEPTGIPLAVIQPEASPSDKELDAYLDRLESILSEGKINLDLYQKLRAEYEKRRAQNSLHVSRNGVEHRI